MPSRATIASRGPLVYPLVGVRRDDLVELYRAIADWALPHVIRRPLTLVRRRAPITRPDALRTQCVYVRHASRDSAWAPEWMPRIRIREQKKTGEYLYIEST